MYSALPEGRRDVVAPNETWATDFVHDQLATGVRLRVLTVVGIFFRYSPVIDPGFSYFGEDVVQPLGAVCAEVGYAKTIRVDQGSKFVSRDVDPPIRITSR